jgi:hypothetical protein
MTRPSPLIAFAFAAGLAAAPAVAAGKGDTSTYVNARYGYAISYPRSLFKAGPESDSGDGRVFRSRRDGAEFRVWANYAAMEMTPAQLAAETEAECRGHHASYRVVKPALVAVSCETDDGVLYQKTMISHGLVTVFRMTYPADQHAYWDPVVTKIASSMRAGRG